jgi:invasion protein IalB
MPAPRTPLAARLRPTLLALALLAAAAPLTAQEATAPAEAPAAPAAGDAPSADGLSLGQEVGGAPAADAAPQVGQTYTAAVFEAWEQRCVKTESGADPCQLYQLLKDSTGNSVAEFSMFALPEGGQAAAGATIVAPLETLLTEQLLLAIDGGKPKIYPFTWCSQIGCIARVGFLPEEVEQFKKGAKASVTIVPVVAPDQKVVVELSLKGFTAGYEAVKASNLAVDAANAAQAEGGN